MIRGVTLGDKHSYMDWGMRMNPVNIPLPVPKNKYIDLPGANGGIDLTEVHGDVVYDYRNFGIELVKLDKRRAWPQLSSMVANCVHGRRLKIVFDDDPDYYYLGRCTVDGLAPFTLTGTITIYVMTEPYKYKREVTQKFFDITASTTVTLSNGRMPVVPTITTDAQMTLAWGVYTKTLAAGTHKILDLVLREGENDISIEGTGSISFVYQEGSL